MKRRNRVKKRQEVWNLPLYEQQAAVNEWLTEHFCKDDVGAVFFTIKFYNIKVAKKVEDGICEILRFDVSERSANSLLSRVLNEIDRLNFSDRQIEGGRRLRRTVFKHLGKGRDNLHFHGVILVDGCAQRLAGQLAYVLRKVAGKTVDVSTCQIDVAHNTKDALHYSAKEVHKIGVDESWMVAHSHIGNRYSKSLQAQDRVLRDEKTRLLREQRLAASAEHSLLKSKIS